MLREHFETKLTGAALDSDTTNEKVENFRYSIFDRTIELARKESPKDVDWLVKTCKERFPDRRSEKRARSIYVAPEYYSTSFNKGSPLVTENV